MTFDQEKLEILEEQFVEAAQKNVLSLLGLNANWVVIDIVLCPRSLIWTYAASGYRWAPNMAMAPAHRKQKRRSSFDADQTLALPTKRNELATRDFDFHFNAIWIQDLAEPNDRILRWRIMFDENYGKKDFEVIKFLDLLRAESMRSQRSKRVESPKQFFVGPNWCSELIKVPRTKYRPRTKFGHFLVRLLQQRLSRSFVGTQIGDYQSMHKHIKNHNSCTKNAWKSLSAKRNATLSWRECGTALKS